MNDVNPATVYATIKRTIAEPMGIKPSGIKAHDRLRDDLHFDEAGVRGLARPLNDAFSGYGIRFTPGQLATCKSVRCIYLLAIKKTGELNA